MTKPFYHELFVYGFDDATARFSVAGFTFKSKYSLEFVEYNIYEAAYSQTISTNKSFMLFWKINENAVYDFDKSQVMMNLDVL